MAPSITVSLSQAVKLTVALLNACPAFKAICEVVRHCPYINTEAVEDQLADQVALFAIRADRCSTDELTELVSMTDPRVLYLVAQRLTVLVQFVGTLETNQIAGKMRYCRTRPASSAIISIWDFYLDCYELE